MQKWLTPKTAKQHYLIHLSWVWICACLWRVNSTDLQSSDASLVVWHLETGGFGGPLFFFTQHPNRCFKKFRAVVRYFWA